MNFFGNALISIILVIGCLTLTSSVSASVGIVAYRGDTITLQGYSYGSPMVYLFLTGPNLPVNGVALNDVSARAEDGHFTEVSVDSNDHWVYNWGTDTINGRLDTGTYTVWVVNGPYDRSRLNNAEFSTITVSLGTPTITAATRAIPGVLVLNTTPDGASVVIGDDYRGSTPLTIDGIEPGTYTVTFSRFGYTKLSTPVQVVAGETTEVNGTLLPLTGSLEITTSPPGTRVLPDTVNRGISPLTLANLTNGNHTITVVNEGYVTTEQNVRIIPGRTTQITVPLVPVSPLNREIFPVSGPGPAILISGFIVILLVIRHLRRK
jgi:hypothetical protein